MQTILHFQHIKLIFQWKLLMWILMGFMWALSWKNLLKKIIF